MNKLHFAALFSFMSGLLVSLAHASPLLAPVMPVFAPIGMMASAGLVLWHLAAPNSTAATDALAQAEPSMAPGQISPVNASSQTALADHLATTATTVAGAVKSAAQANQPASTLTTVATLLDAAAGAYTAVKAA